MRRGRAPVLLAAGLLAGCPGSSSEHHPAREAPAAAAPRLTHPAPCPDARGFTCSTLRVPLDRATPGGAALRLRVAVQRRSGRQRDLLVLTGGPGQPGEPFAASERAALGPAATGYRLVLLDQRGTGGGALRCPALQAATGSSDLAVAPPRAVRTCARALGPRRAHFATADTVADLEDLRRALGAERLAVLGVSYGTFVAERYALAHPARVSALVLDSVVPQAGAPLLATASLAATRRVLGEVCGSRVCARDLARVAARDGSVELLDAIVSLSVGAPAFPGLAAALHAGASGRPAVLRRYVARVRGFERASAGELSAGLHAATLCADSPAPWGGPDAPLARRGPALAAAVHRLPARVLWPWTRRTAAGQGLARTCLAWPPAPAPPRARVEGDLPAVPTVLLAGTRDLSTPLAWARAELAHAPDGRLVVVPGAGHSVLRRSPDPRARAAVRRALR